MFIKPQTVIPVGVKVTRLAPSTKRVPSLYSLERAHERQLELQAEQKRQSEKFSALLKAGYSVKEALKLIVE